MVKVLAFKYHNNYLPNMQKLQAKLSYYLGTNIKNMKLESIIARVLLLSLIKDYDGKTGVFKLIINKDRSKPNFMSYKNIHFSITHSAKIVAVAISTEDIGIDIEIKRKYNEVMLKRIATSQDRSIFCKKVNSLNSEQVNNYWTKYWTYVESTVKSKGLSIFNNNFNLLCDDGTFIEYSGGSYYKSAKICGYLITICSNSRLEQCNIQMIGKEEFSRYYEQL